MHPLSIVSALSQQLPTPYGAIELNSSVIISGLNPPHPHPPHPHPPHNCPTSGAVTHSLLCWDTALPGTGRKGREGGGVREVAVSIAPFQKRLAYLRDGAGLEDVQTVLHRTVDPVSHN